MMKFIKNYGLAASGVAACACITMRWENQRGEFSFPAKYRNDPIQRAYTSISQ